MDPDVIDLPPTCPVGNGVTLVALPGWGASQWSFPCRLFSVPRTLGCRVLVMSYGSALSSIEDMAAHVWAQLRALHADCNIVLCGYSMGGFVAQAMMLAPWAQSAVRGMVLIATGCAQEGAVPIAPEMQAAIASGAVLHREDVASSLLSLFPRAYLFRQPAAYITGVLVPFLETARIPDAARAEQGVAILKWAMSASSCAVLARVTCPVLILQGDNDTVIAPCAARQLHALIPRSTMRVLPGVGHAVPVQAARQASDMIGQWMWDNGLVLSSIVPTSLPTPPTCEPAAVFAWS